MVTTTTVMGTPRAESWDEGWIEFVAETEARLGRRICGAHAPDGEPCELSSTHPSGRCRFHGGHPRIGGQPGNTNALIHGLYSRRLRQCNNTCPIWTTCPFSGADVTALSERKRPVCAYEREAYAVAMGLPEMEWSAAAYFGGTSNFAEAGHSTGVESSRGDSLRDVPFAVAEPGQSIHEGMIAQLRFRNTPFGRKGVTTKFPRDAAGSTSTTSPIGPEASQGFDGGEPDHAPAMIEDTSGILYAMLQRATLTLSAHTLTENTEAQGERYTFRSTKMSAGLHAYLRIGRELRAWLHLRPAPANAEASKFDDDLERPELNEQGYQQYYDHKGNKIGLPSLMHPFLHELDATVEHLKQHGINLPPPERPKHN